MDKWIDLKALKVARHVLHLTRRVLLDSLQLPPMGLLLGRLMGPQLCQLGLQYYTRKV